MGHLGRVLVVDDDVEWREIVAELLQDAGYAVTTADNGRRALELIAASPPTVVMTDMQMPVMDGRELLAHAHAVDGRLPVIIVTGNPETETGALLGAFRVLCKRGTPDQLLDAIAAAMAHRAQQLPLGKLWRAAERVVIRRRRPSLFANVRSGMRSYFRSTSARFAVAAAVLVSALLVHRAIKA